MSINTYGWSNENYKQEIKYLQGIGFSYKQAVKIFNAANTSAISTQCPYKACRKDIIKLIRDYR